MKYLNTIGHGIYNFLSNGSEIIACVCTYREDNKAGVAKC